MRKSTLVFTLLLLQACSSNDKKNDMGTGGGHAGSSSDTSAQAGNGGSGGDGAEGGDQSTSSSAGGSTTSGGATGAVGGSTASTGTGWVGSWATAQQLTETGNLPPTPPGLTNNTLRQIFQVSIGGQRVRLHFSNEYGSSPVTLKAVHCAKSVSGHTVDTATDKTLTFGGAESVTIPAAQTVVSDPIDFDLAPLSKVAVSIYFGETSTEVTGHPGSRTTSYIQTGDGAALATLSSPSTTDHWYILSGLDVAAGDDTRAVAILGDSITDGRGSTTNGNNRWPDALAKRLQGNADTNQVGVLNQGIGGNAVLSGGLGPTALTRFDRDILNQSGVRWAIVFEGVNDIGYSSGATIATNLINAYSQFVTKARSKGVLVYGATITPFGANSYYSVAHEEARQAVNDWIRTQGNFDAVIDFDATVRDPLNAINLLSAYSSDGLHLNPTGYQKMADSIDLSLFAK
ncbi:MAG: SGNH/GDSL hydrolase family protein [Polyangiaceae bacterium]